MGERPAGRRYRFGPLERRGLIAGWRGGQVLAACGGVAVAVAVLRRHAGPGSIVVAVAAVAAGLATGWWPVAGRTAEEWAPTVLRWARPPGARRRWRARVAQAGHVVGVQTATSVHGPAASVHGRPQTTVHGGPPTTVRGPWGRVSILAATTAEGTAMGVVHDPVAVTCAAAVRLLGHSFALLGPADQDRRVGAWASVLAAHARERPTVHRLQWLVTSAPDDGWGVRRHLETAAVLGADTEAHRSYRGLLAAGAETRRHDVLLVVSVRAPRRPVRARVGPGGLAGAVELLGREIAALERQLLAADVAVDAVLDGAGLAAHVSSVLGPDAPGDGQRVERVPGAEAGAAWPWPVALDERWDAVRADAMWHATYWIAEWPRTDVGAEFLAPLLLGAVRRRVALVMEPLSPSRATRRAQRARTADIADAELRRRGGFTVTARRAKEAAVAVHREEELADGHAAFRMSGYVTVSAPTLSELADGCDATLEAAARSHIELRRLYGEQAAALACTLPLARGLS